MQEIQPYLLVGLLSSFVGSTLALLVAFLLWIFSLRSELQIYAPLVDAPLWAKRTHHMEGRPKGPPSPSSSPSHKQIS